MPARSPRPRRLPQLIAWRAAGPARARRRARIAVAALLALLLAGCDAPPASTPALPTSPPPTALPPSARTAVLRPDQLPGYRRLEDAVVTADSLAQQNGDPPSPPPGARYAGLLDGTRETFDSSTAPLPSVISEAIVFDTPANARRFLADERQRRSQPPAGGGLTVLQVPTAQGVDEQLVLQATVPPPTPTQPGQVAYLAVLRAGAVVAELQAGGDPGAATPERFEALIAAQVAQLAH